MKQSAFKTDIGWLDFGEEDQRRAREYLAQFKEDNTLDELGFGIVRDALADLFFPGTNTIMTRTRYLIFIPALCLIVEREHLAGEKAARRLKALEDQLREALTEKESSGVIGERAKESLSRYPSSIYWNALRRLGVFVRQNWGLGYYVSQLAALHKAMEAEKDDDGLSHLRNPERYNWDKTLCTLLNEGHSFLTSKGEIPSTVSFALTRQEARYLKGTYQMLAEKDGRPSLLSYLLEKNFASLFGYPWEVPHPPELAPYINHARCFSIFVRGVTLQYFALLQEERRIRSIDKKACDYSDVFKRWWEATRQTLGEWDVEEFLNITAQLQAIRRPNDSTFVKGWFGLAVNASNAKAVWESTEARALIRARERLTRPHKARLHHPDYLKRWKPLSAAELSSIAVSHDQVRYGLDYRAWIGNAFVQDIMAAL